MAFHERLSEYLKLFQKEQCSMKVARKGSLNAFLKEVCQSVRSPLQAFYLKKKEYVYINSIYTKMDLIKNERDALWQDDETYWVDLSFHHWFFYLVTLLKNFICGAVKTSVNITGNFSIFWKYCHRFSYLLAEAPLRNFFQKSFWWRCSESNIHAK